MNYYVEPSGFLGTGASLAADITLIVYLLLIIPGMLAGWYFARHGKHRPHHKMTMTFITLLNWVLIIGLMVVAYRFDVVDNITQKPTNFRYLMPTIHALFGIPAQLLATIVIVNMWREDSQVAAAKKRGETELSKYWWKRAKPVMRITIILWLITATFGVVSYLIRYDVLSLPTLGETMEPVVTEEPEPTAEIVLTEEVAPTDEPIATEEVAPTDEPAATEEADSTDEPAATEEMDPATTEEAGD